MAKGVFMNSERKFKLLENDYFIRILGAEDEETLQHLCERCMDYYEIVEGRLPEKDAGHEILNDLPPAKEFKDKHVLGCFNENNILIAVIDIIADYPDQGEWIIGLLMIDPKERGRGLGKVLHEFIKSYVLMHKADKLRIGVVLENIKAYSFWKSLGYYKIKRVNMRCGNKDNDVVVMNLLLS
jgi:ribosomal protein S18 acetylase RimI-like enzyme